MSKIVTLRPKRPVVCFHIEDVKHVIFQDIDSGRILPQFLCVILTKVSVFEDGREPRRPVGEFFNLNRFLNNNAV